MLEGQAAGSLPWTDSYVWRRYSRWSHSLRATFTPVDPRLKLIHGVTRWGGIGRPSMGPMYWRRPMTTASRASRADAERAQSSPRPPTSPGR